MKRWISVGLAMALPVQSFGSTFKILGIKPMGMGGANVAVADGPTAQYWNPGALALSPGSGLQIPIGVGFEATGNVLQKADSLSDAADKISSLQSQQKAGGSISLTQVRDFNDAVVKLTSLNHDGTGALVGVAGGVNARVKRVAVSLNNFTEGGATPFVDTKFDLGALSGSGGISVTGASSLNDSADTASRDQVATVIDNMTTKFGLVLSGGATSVTAANQLVNDARASGLTTQQIADLAAQAESLSAQLLASGLSGAGAPAVHGARSPAATSGSSDNAFANNSSNITLRGASMSEAAVGYGHPISGRFGDLGIGGNLKMIRGDIGYAKVNILSGEDTDLSDIKNTKTTYKPSADLGALWRAPFDHALQVGLLARNINSPTFAQPALAAANGEAPYKAAMQSRAGVAFWPWKRLTLASDLDLTRNDTVVPGFRSRNWGAGAELNILFLSLRAGVLKNIQAGTPLSYTAGVGLNLFALKIDLGAAISSKSVEVNSAGAKIPTSCQAGLSVSLVFGGNSRAAARRPQPPPAPKAEPAKATPSPVEPAPAKPMIGPSPAPAEKLPSDQLKDVMGF